MGEVNYAPLIDDMVWSYSRIKAFEDCPYRWYLKYIKKFHGKDMFFSSYGTFMHKLIELYHKGEKTPRQIVDMYLQDFKTEVVDVLQTGRCSVVTLLAACNILKHFSHSRMAWLVSKRKLTS